MISQLSLYMVNLSLYIKVTTLFFVKWQSSFSLLLVKSEKIIFGRYIFRASSSLLISPPYPSTKTIEFIPCEAKTQKIKRIDHCKCNVRASKNAGQAFSTPRLSSHFLFYQISGFLSFGSRWKLVFKSWMGIRGLPRRLWFSLEWISLEEDTFLLDCIKIIFTYSYLMENFSLVSSHNLLENPLLFPTEITNLLFVIKTNSRWNKILCWIAKNYDKEKRIVISIAFCDFALWNFDSENFGLVFPKFSFFEAKWSV